METPAAKRARLKKERQQELDKKREETMNKLEEEVRKASAARAEEAKKISSKPTVNAKAVNCNCSSALEEAILAELQKGGDDSVTLFLFSLADGLRALPNPQFRQFQLQVLQILSKFEADNESTPGKADSKLQLSKDQLVCTLLFMCSVLSYKYQCISISNFCFSFSAEGRRHFEYGGKPAGCIDLRHCHLRERPPHLALWHVAE